MPRSTPANTGAIYEIGGPQVMSFRDILEATLRYSGRRGCCCRAVLVMQSCRPC